MRIAVTGSIASDYLMAFPGRFADQLLADHLQQVSLSFLVDDLEVRKGGVGANIAYGLGCLGLDPILVGAAGRDFAEYDAWLRAHGVDTSAVHVSETKHTARFLCTTDQDENQIASFYAGAMSEARDITLAPLAAEGLDLVLVGANDPDAMAAHVTECRELRVPFAADPSQQLARIDGHAARHLVQGAKFLFTNEYEAELLLAKTEWTRAEVLNRVETWVTTLGAEGVRIDQRNTDTVRIPAVAPTVIADPTGVGDGFRAGFLFGIARGLDLRDAAQLGCVVATTVLEAKGPQDYELTSADVLRRAAEAYQPVSTG